MHGATCTIKPRVTVLGVRTYGTYVRTYVCIYVDSWSRGASCPSELRTYSDQRDLCSSCRIRQRIVQYNRCGYLRVNWVATSTIYDGPLQNIEAWNMRGLDASLVFTHYGLSYVHTYSTVSSRMFVSNETCNIIRIYRWDVNTIIEKHRCKYVHTYRS